MSNEKSIVKLLADLASVFQDVEPSERMVGMYTKALADIEPEKLAWACHQWMKTGKRFPYPADLLELC
ncbi:MAG TPA: hypothetical protein ENK05_08680 [Gammaproteobacteria bacterium]|nr:hypothetical protein [Gammaproteobacteria bacterium]